MAAVAVFAYPIQTGIEKMLLSHCRGSISGIEARSFQSAGAFPVY